MPDGMLKCGIHDFSTDDIVQWDKHCEELDHEYDTHTECHCGKKIHVKPKTKLSIKSKRIPRNCMCDDCKKNMMNTSEIKDEVVV